MNNPTTPTLPHLSPATPRQTTYLIGLFARARAARYGLISDSDYRLMVTKQLDTFNRCMMGAQEPLTQRQASEMISLLNRLLYPKTETEPFPMKED